MGFFVYKIKNELIPFNYSHSVINFNSSNNKNTTSHNLTFLKKNIDIFD